MALPALLCASPPCPQTANASADIATIVTRPTRRKGHLESKRACFIERVSYRLRNDGQTRA
jgi:hypothetical protein